MNLPTLTRTRAEAERLAWPSPLQEAFPHILARRGERVCVLASGLGVRLALKVDPATALGS